MTIYYDDVVLAGTAYQPEDFGQNTGGYADDVVYVPAYVAAAAAALAADAIARAAATGALAGTGGGLAGDAQARATATGDLSGGTPVAVLTGDANAQATAAGALTGGTDALVTDPNYIVTGGRKRRKRLARKDPEESIVITFDYARST